MTYYEAYTQCKSFEEAKKKAVEDARIAVMLGNNPDRIRAIEDAINKAEKYFADKEVGA